MPLELPKLRSVRIQIVQKFRSRGIMPFSVHIADHERQRWLNEPRWERERERETDGYSLDCILHLRRINLRAQVHLHLMQAHVRDVYRVSCSFSPSSFSSPLIPCDISIVPASSRLLKTGCLGEKFNGPNAATRYDKVPRVFEVVRVLISFFFLAIAVKWHGGK